MSSTVERSVERFPYEGRYPVAEIKRLLERVAADPEFKEGLLSDPRGAAERLGIAWNPEELRPLYDRAAAEGREVSAEVRAYAAFIAAKLRYRNELRAQQPIDPRLRVWRERQIARVLLELGPARADSIVHAPFCVELNKGCSVGCWFCGVGAPRLGDVWPYTDENADVWRGVLHVMEEIFGRQVASAGFCYWATDPLDNPDYERFCLDFARILGLFPQTTTALALRFPERVRKLLRTSEEHGCRVNRFSLLSLKQFREAQSVFTAQELVNVECIAQNKESTLMIARAGKAAGNRGHAQEVADHPGTIACVSGFLFNMVEGSVKLITPCAASTAWPLGYWIVDEASFTRVEELRERLRAMIDRRLVQTVRALPQVRLARFLQWRQVEDGVELSSAVAQITFRDPDRAQRLAEIIRLVAEGAHPAEDVATICRYTAGLHPDYTMQVLERLFSAGALDEDPSA